MTRVHNPYGDGRASEWIASLTSAFLTRRETAAKPAFPVPLAFTRTP